MTMAIISCPRCGGSDEEPRTGLPCRFCEGAGQVKIDTRELEEAIR